MNCLGRANFCFSKKTDVTCLFVYALGFDGINKSLVKLSSNGHSLFCGATYEPMAFQYIFIIGNFAVGSSDAGKHWWMLWIQSRPFGIFEFRLGQRAE